VFQRFSQSHHRCRALRLVVTTLLVALSCPQPAMAAGQTPGVKNEYDFKLSRLFVTSKFIAWPHEVVGTAAGFVIGVIDPDPFRGELQKLSTRKFKDRPIRVVKSA